MGVERGDNAGRPGRSGALRGLQLIHGIAAQLVQLMGTRREGSAGDFEIERGKFVGRIPQAAQLRAQIVFVDRTVARSAQQRLALRRDRDAAGNPLLS